MKTTRSRVRIVRGLIVAVLAVCISLGAGSTASAERPDCADRGVPDGKISIQLWTFAEYVGFGTDPATIARLEEVLSRLSDMGYRNVEPFTLSGLSAEEYGALLDKYGLKASGRHVNVGTPESPVDFQQILEENRTLGIEFFGWRRGGGRLRGCRRLARRGDGDQPGQHDDDRHDRRSRRR